jgi:hypothetical protein
MARMCHGVYALAKNIPKRGLENNPSRRCLWLAIWSDIMEALTSSVQFWSIYTLWQTRFKERPFRCGCNTIHTSLPKPLPLNSQTRTSFFSSFPSPSEISQASQFSNPVQNNRESRDRPFVEHLGLIYQDPTLPL